MILVIVGTHWQPFPRAIQRGFELLDPGEELVVQHGHTPPTPHVLARWMRWCPRAKLDSLICAARVVVVHGGSGCIFQALHNGKRPVVEPRLARYCEHVDDHQTQLPKRLAREFQVVVWNDGDGAASVKAKLEQLVNVAPPVQRDLRPAVWEAARVLSR